jgi:hypothetical protein
MYTILVNDDDTLYGSHKERIMQRSKLVDNLVFIVNPIYRNTHDMTNATVMLEYLRPISKKYETEILVLSDERYNGFLQYKLPLDTNLTSEHGSLELQLTFAYVELDAKGNNIQRVRKTSATTIEIVPISAWADIIPDQALGGLDQRLIVMNAQIRALDEMNQIVADSKADNIKYNKDTNELQLLSGEKEIGNKVTLKNGDTSLEDGVPVVDFNSASDGNFPSEDEENNVVEF